MKQLTIAQRLACAAISLLLVATLVVAGELHKDATFIGTLNVREVTTRLPISMLPPLDLTRNVAHTVDSRVTGQTFAEASPIFTTQDHVAGTYVRNPLCWAADLDLTAISPWNAHYGVELGGTAVSPRHIVLAEHFVVSSGLRAALPVAFRFVTANNVVVTRNVTAVTQVGSTDLAIGLLDSDLPSTIGFAKVLASTWSNYVTAAGSPLLIVDKEEKALVANLVSVGGGTVTHAVASASPRVEFTEALVTGDSGSPICLVAAEELMLMTTAFSTTTGPSLISNIAAINGVMTTLGGGYTLTTVDLAGYDSLVDVPALKVKTTTGDLATPGKPTIVINETDNVVKIYADGAWRTLVSW